MMRIFSSSLAMAAVCLLFSSVAVAEDSASAAVARDVAKNLKTSGQMEDYHIGVKYRGGVAWLVGSVTDVQQEKAAVEIAEATQGVDKVISKLAIEGGPSARSRSSAGIVSSSGSGLSARSGSSSSGLLQPGASKPADSWTKNITRRDDRVRPASNRAPVRTGSVRTGLRRASANMPLPAGRILPTSHSQPIPGYTPSPSGASPARFDQPQMPGYAWPSYAAYPNYAAVTYPKQYSPTAWPFIGPFYPYPQVPLGWRKVTLEWDDGWWMLDFKDH